MNSRSSGEPVAASTSRFATNCETALRDAEELLFCIRARLQRLRKKSLYEGYGLQPVHWGSKTVGFSH
jgi:hypothetical protein